MTIRIGQGFDAHRFADNDTVDQDVHIILGGVAIPYSQGLLAHSDGDVVLHALTDALLGSLALGDIGQHFPDTDPRYKGVDSRSLLKAAYEKIMQAGYRLVNTDITIIAQAPKMAPHIDAMRANIADDLQIEMTSVSVKATTTEKMGFTGRGEGIAVQATVLVQAG